MTLLKLLAFSNFAYTILVLNYSSVGFMVPSFSSLTLFLPKHFGALLLTLDAFSACIFQVLSLHETLVAYGSVYFIGTILPIVVILLSYVIKPARPSRSKARKEQ